MPDPDYKTRSAPGADESSLDTVATAASPADIRFAAMNLLARREHSLAELRQKLRRRFTDEIQLESQLQKLAEEKLQCDERYAESFARQRTTRGYGPLRVRQEMREKGLTDQAVSAALEAADVDWVALAAAVFRKKFGRHDCVDVKEKARRIRFMQYRGFSPEHYQTLLED
jgi:regulatory protein